MYNLATRSVCRSDSGLISIPKIRTYFSSQVSLGRSIAYPRILEEPGNNAFTTPGTGNVSALFPRSLSELSRTAQHSTVQHRTAQHSTIQHRTAQHSTIQHRTVQHSTTQHRTAKHSTMQHRTAQHSTTQQQVI